MSSKSVGKPVVKSVGRTAGAWTIAIAAAASLVGGVRLGALPRYGARYEQECALCHISPSGGGMRTPYATKDLVPHEFVIGAHPSGEPAAAPARLAPGVSFGLDQRLLYTWADPAPAGLDFFLMQTDIYAAFQPDPKVILYVDRGLSETLETFGMYYGLPWKGYLKAGRFVAPYGLRFDDHTHYVRDDLGFTPAAMSDVGLEAGISPPGGNLQVALLNGNRGSDLGADQHLAGSLSGSVRFRVGPMAVSLGGSGYREEGVTADLDMAGAFSYLTVGNLAWVGEADVAREVPVGAPTAKRFAMTHELSFMPVQGVEVLGTYDYFDPDIDAQTGSKDRWGAGLQLYPHQAIVFSASYSVEHYVPGIQMAGTNTKNVIVQLHFLY